MGELSISVLILSLAKMEVCWDVDLSEDSRISIRNGICSQVCIREHALSSLLFGLSRLGRKWNTLHLAVKKVLKEAIVVHHISDLSSARGVTSSLLGLASMDARWSELSSSVRLAILKEALRVTGELSGSQLVSITHSLSEMGVRWDHLKEELKQALLATLKLKVPLMSRHQLAQLLLSLGRMGKRWEDFSMEMQTEFLSSLTRLEHAHSESLKLYEENHQPVPLLSVETISVLFSGLGALQIVFHTLPKELSQALLWSLRRSCSALTAPQLGQLIAGIAQVGLRAGQQLGSTLPSLIEAAQRTLPCASTADASSIISGLGALGLTWSSPLLPLALRRIIIGAVGRISQFGEPSEVGSTAFALGVMEAVWIDIPDKVRASMMSGVIRVSKHEELTSKDAANLMYAMSLLCFDVNESTLHQDLVAVHLSLLNSIRKIGIGSFTDKERSQVLIFLQFIKHLTRVGKEADRHIIKVDRDETIPMSRLQMSVVTALTEALESSDIASELVLENEYSAFAGAFPVDATIWREGHVVAFIEIDGPQHYYRGELRRKDIFKEALYRRKYPNAAFARIRYDQVRKLGTETIGAKAAALVSLVHPQGEQMANRRAERDFQLALECCDKSEGERMKGMK